MQRRSKLRPQVSRKIFRKSVDQTHKFNKGFVKNDSGLRRGGIRL